MNGIGEDELDKLVKLDLNNFANFFRICSYEEYIKIKLSIVLNVLNNINEDIFSFKQCLDKNNKLLVDNLLKREIIYEHFRSVSHHLTYVMRNFDYRKLMEYEIIRDINIANKCEIGSDGDYHYPDFKGGKSLNDIDGWYEKPVEYLKKTVENYLHTLEFSDWEHLDKHYQEFKKKLEDNAI
jgi:hypothetical protein